MDKDGDTTFFIRQITKQDQKFDHAWMHILDHCNITNDTISRQKRGMILAIHNFLYGKKGSQDVKQLKKNVAIQMHNQNL